MPPINHDDHPNLHYRIWQKWVKLPFDTGMRPFLAFGLLMKHVPYTPKTDRNLGHPWGAFITINHVL